MKDQTRETKIYDLFQKDRGKILDTNAIIQFLENIIMSAKLWMAFLDLKGNILIWNFAAEEITGYTRDEVIGHDKIWKWIYPDDKYRKEVTKKIVDIISNKKYLENFETDIRTKKGETRRIRWNTRELSDNDSRTIGYVVLGNDITEIVKARQEIQRNAEFQESIIINAKLWMMFLDKKSNVVIWNKAAEEITGYTHDEVIGNDKIWKWIYPDDRYRKEVTKKIVDIISNKKYLENFETNIRTKTGETRRISWNTRELTGDEGEQLGYIVVGNDITEIAKAKREIKRNAEFQESIIINAKLWMMFLDKKSNVVIWNKAAEEITGYTYDEVIGNDKIWKWIYPDDRYRKEVTKKIVDIINNKKYLENFEANIRTKTGETRRISWNTRELTGDEGERLGYIVVGNDITVIAKAKQDLKERMELFHGITAAASDAIILLDQAGLIHYWNPAAEKIFGVSLDGVMKKDFFMLFSLRKFIETDKNGFKTFYENGSGPFAVGHRELKLKRYSGEVLPVEISLSPVQIHGQWNAIGVIRDITERKQAEERLERFNEDLERGISERTQQLESMTINLKKEITERMDAEEKIRVSLAEKEVLLREIHHRVNNNLQIMISLLNLQARQIKDKKTQRSLQESRNRLQTMALVHERLYQSKDISKIELVSFARYLSSQLFSFYETDSRLIKISIETGEIMVDINTAIPFSLILMELISNALKHAFPDGRKGEISIRIRLEANMLTLAVKDNGVGIPQALDWRNTESLGLRLVMSLVEQLNGTIELDQDSGTAFRITIRKKTDEHGRTRGAFNPVPE
jgi:PAS domain S-box-containing protein